MFSTSSNVKKKNLYNCTQTPKHMYSISYSKYIILQQDIKNTFKGFMQYSFYIELIDRQTR